MLPDENPSKVEPETTQRRPAPPRNFGQPTSPKIQELRSRYEASHPDDPAPPEQDRVI